MLLHWLPGDRGHLAASFIQTHVAVQAGHHVQVVPPLATVEADGQGLVLKQSPGSRRLEIQPLQISQRSGRLSPHVLRVLQPCVLGADQRAVGSGKSDGGRSGKFGAWPSPSTTAPAVKRAVGEAASRGVKGGGSAPLLWEPREASLQAG